MDRINKRIVDFLNEAGVYYLATEDEGQPRVRPFGATIEFEGKIYFCTNNTKKIFKQLLKNPKVEISGMDRKGKWIRLSGTAVVDDRDEVRKAMIIANPFLSRMYSIGDGIFEVFYIKEVKASIHSFTSEPEVLLD